MKEKRGKENATAKMRIPREFCFRRCNTVHPWARRGRLDRRGDDGQVEALRHDEVLARDAEDEDVAAPIQLCIGV